MLNLCSVNINVHGSYTCYLTALLVGRSLNHFVDMFNKDFGNVPPVHISSVIPSRNVSE